MARFGLIILFILGLAGTVDLHRMLADMTTPPPPPHDPRRIVSLAPSITETLYAIGLGEQVVGVTQFCHYPPEVLDKPKVAGFSDINMEAVLRQRPDLIVLPVDKLSNRSNLERLGLTVLPLDTRSLLGLLAAVRQLGESTNHEIQAQTVLRRLDDSIARARKRAVGQPRPKVLFSVMHAYEGLGYITEINAVGADGFFSELIEIAGGINAYQGALAFPRLSREAILFLDPEVIIDVVFGHEDLEAVRRDWQSLSSVRAIKNGRLYLLTDEADTVPGPRVYQTLGKLSAAFHPEDNHAAD